MGRRQKVYNKSRKRQFLKKPKYPGGSKALKAFIEQHLRYPTEALYHRIEGDVHVAYEVDEKGQVVRARVLRGIGYGCDEEAVRVVKMLRYEGVRNRHVRVTTHFTIVIHFRLPSQPVVQYRYQYCGQGDSNCFEYRISLPANAGLSHNGKD